ncbi:MAG: hypothetical protein J0H78_19035 [Rhizobiales bacterium]|nr:hypothetical protein [Hyphomicrobiales bacterium]
MPIDPRWLPPNAREPEILVTFLSAPGTPFFVALSRVLAWRRLPGDPYAQVRVYPFHCNNDPTYWGHRVVEDDDGFPVLRFPGVVTRS